MSDENRDRDVRKGSVFAGLSAGGAFLTGVLGVAGSFLSSENGGLYLLAAAIAFGLLANAAFRR